MRNTFNYTVRALLLTALTAGLTACEIQECTECPDTAGEPATLTLSVSPTATKSTQTPSDETDKTLNTIDVLIFNSSGSGQLDVYRRFEEGQTQLEIQTTTGSKKVCVVANAKSLQISSVTSYSQLQEMVADLNEELFGNLTMYGEKDVTMTAQTTETITVSRFISRITVTSVKTDFAGTPYKDMTLNNCKLYLINANADKLLYNGEPTGSPVILNEGGLVTEDVTGTAQTGLLMDEISETISDAGYSTPHYLYCYSNETSDIASCTKLVLQADIDGTTYYYPIPVNQEEYGYVTGNGHHGIKRNTVYSMGISISRPGSTDPDTPIEPGTLDLSISVADWTEVPEFDKEF